MAGFEPATSSSQTRRDDRATLHPELIYFAERQGFEPWVPLRVRLFSKQVLSATQAPLQYVNSQLLIAVANILQVSFSYKVFLAFFKVFFNHLTINTFSLDTQCASGIY